MAIYKELWTLWSAHAQGHDADIQRIDFTSDAVKQLVKQGTALKERAGTIIRRHLQPSETVRWE